MRIVILAFLFCLISSIANAEQYQVRKVMICDKSEIIFGKLATEFKETPIWGGKDIQDGSGYVVTSNKDTGDWTLLQYDKETACVIGVGTSSKIVSNSKTSI